MLTGMDDMNTTTEGPAPKLTVNTITDAQIKALADEAGWHGDSEQVRICERALNGSKRARRECARVINEARAMGHDDAGKIA